MGDGPVGVRLAAGVDSRVVVVDGEAGTVLRDVPIGSAARSLALAPDGNRLLAQRVDGSVVAIDVIAGTVDDQVQEPDASAFALDDGAAASWSGMPSSSFRAFATSARRAVLDDAHGITLYRLDPVDAPTPVGTVSGTVTALRWKPDGTRHAITTDGRCIDLATGDGQEPLGDVLVVTADGEHLLLDVPLRLRSVTSQAGCPLAVERRVVAAGFSEDGSRFAVATWGSLSVFDVGTGWLVTRFGEHDDEEGDLYQGIALDRDGTRLVTSSPGGGRAHVWDVDTGEALGPVPRDLPDTSPDGADVIARGFRDIVTDLSAGVEIRLGAPPGDVTMVVAPNGTAMAAVRADSYGSASGGLLHEYSLPDFHPLGVDARECVAATFSPDALHLLTARPDGTIDLSASRDPADVLTRTRRHVFRELGPDDRASFDL